MQSEYHSPCSDLNSRELLDSCLLHISTQQVSATESSILVQEAAKQYLGVELVSSIALHSIIGTNSPQSAHVQRNLNGR